MKILIAVAVLGWWLIGFTGAIGFQQDWYTNQFNLICPTDGDYVFAGLFGVVGPVGYVIGLATVDNIKDAHPRFTFDVPRCEGK